MYLLLVTIDETEGFNAEQAAKEIAQRPDVKGVTIMKEDGHNGAKVLPSSLRVFGHIGDPLHFVTPR